MENSESNLIGFIVAASFVSLFVGAGLGLIYYRYLHSRALRWAKEEANEIIGEIKEQIELKNLEEQERIQEIETECWTKIEGDLLKAEERIEDRQELGVEKKEKLDLLVAENQKKFQEFEKLIQESDQKVKTRESALNKTREITKELNDDLKNKIAHRLQITIEEFRTELANKWIDENTKRIYRIAEEFVEDTKQHAESKAKRIIAIAIDRFARPYSAERGIGAVNFPDAHARRLFCDPQGLNIKAVQEFCGCDIIVEEGMEMVGVAGFDPVRRELTRRTLERLFKEKKTITPEIIKRIAENQKHELFKNIRHDGDQIARELKQDGLHPEIKQMMGSLRFRYSFTQNQYFHCGEVGWLAGLMAGELRSEIRKARRCGLLHDLGKSMDHVMDGGHAVIGANFIEARGEAPDVVRAVRAHHYDVTPESDLEFLVIAADAISGARPGARRSTIETYNQKVTELQDIARSFEGVTDCFILSGGRECRVMVNGRKVDDPKALEMSKKIAGRIEEECSYPGQIKVVVVRETVAAESTAAKGH